MWSLQVFMFFGRWGSIKCVCEREDVKREEEEREKKRRRIFKNNGQCNDSTNGTDKGSLTIEHKISLHNLSYYVYYNRKTSDLHNKQKYTIYACHKTSTKRAKL